MRAAAPLVRLARLGDRAFKATCRWINDTANRRGWVNARNGVLIGLVARRTAAAAAPVQVE